MAFRGSDFFQAGGAALAGMSVGIGAGSMVELVANEAVHALELHTFQVSTSKDKKYVGLAAEVLVRSFIGAFGLLLSTQAMGAISDRSLDPTNGAFFGYGYFTAQDKLYDAVRKLSVTLTDDGDACCDNCASGETCASEK